MENNLITMPAYQIIVGEAGITFTGKELMVEKAQEFLEYVKSLEVNEENIKQAKKGAAVIRKQTNALEDKRKRVKRILMAPYDEFKTQIEEITNVLNEADVYIRNQVNVLEEFERIEKKDKIKDIFEKRNIHYDFKFLKFEHFFKERYLNKTMTINKVETEMVEWFEGIKKDLCVINSLDHSAEIIDIYIQTQDLADSIAKVKERFERVRSIEFEITPESHKTHQISFNNEVDYNLAIMLLKQHRITYRVI